jgi:hypothetical protein
MKADMFNDFSRAAVSRQRMLRPGFGIFTKLSWTSGSAWQRKAPKSRDLIAAWVKRLKEMLQ